MPNLMPETQEQLRAQCRKISVAHDLDPELQEELYGHMEDKALAYLSGDEAITESDALILVREHFGDPKVIKGLMGEVHMCAVTCGVFRRLGAIAAATLIVWSTTFALKGVLQYAIIAYCIWTGRESAAVLSFNADFIWVAGTLAVLWLIVRHWTKQLKSGASPWFIRWRPISILFLLAVLATLVHLTPTVRVAEGVKNVIEPSPGLLSLALAVAYLLGTVAIWILWCDAPPRTRQSILWAVVGFAAASALPPATELLPKPVIYVTASYMPEFALIQPEDFGNVSLNLALNIALPLITGATMALFIRLTQRLHQRFRPAAK